jgi:hypothetical protein
MLRMDLPALSVAETGRTEPRRGFTVTGPAPKTVRPLFSGARPCHSSRLVVLSFRRAIRHFHTSGGRHPSRSKGEQMLRMWVVAGIALAASSGPTLAQEAAAGEQVFKRLCSLSRNRAGCQNQARSTAQRHRWPQERHLRRLQLLPSQ